VKRWVLVVLWFAALFVWNIVTKWSVHPDASFGYKCLEAIGYMTSLIELLLSAVVMLVIWKQKPLSER